MAHHIKPKSVLSYLLDFERLIQNVNSLLQAFCEVFQLQMTNDDPLSIAMK
jgi:hypothetical protein